MCIFGNTTHHNASTLDTGLTYTYSSLLIISVLAALLLNPVVLLYNTMQPTKLVTTLFQLLALIDTIFLIRPVNALYNLLKPQQDPIYIRDPSLGRKMVCVITYVTGFSSMFLTLTLCVVRYVMIRFPFWCRSHEPWVRWAVVFGITVDFLWNLSASLYTNFSPDTHYWASATQSVLAEPANGKNVAYIRVLLIIGPFFFKIGLSVVFSLLTLVYLRTDDGLQVSPVKKRSIVTILLLNLGNIVWCVVSLFVQSITRFQNAPVDPVQNPDWKYWFYYLQFVESILMQSALVAYNPLVICSRNTGIRRMLEDLVKKGRLIATPDRVNSSDAASRGMTRNRILSSLGRSISDVSTWSRARLFER